jgi:aryl-alcohol dehydrogenase-like predicted oxidoreductase
VRAADRRVTLGLYRAGPDRDLLARALDLGVTALDTAYNYGHFTSHRLLGEVAGDLLSRFDISTKVGFFPDAHDLSPDRLRAAIEQSARDLGRAPDTVMLHNPEQSPGQLTAACSLLAGLRDQGWFSRWGISVWEPQLLTVLPHEGPAPDVLMTRAGLMVPATVLDAADTLSGLLVPAERWGMAPFGHDTRAPVWAAVDTTLFLAPGTDATRIEAAFAAAFEIPPVSRIAVGTRNPSHLAQLARARFLEASPGAIASYRRLLRDRTTVGVPPSETPARERHA